MKTLRIIFISMLIITIVAAVIIGIVSANYAADNGDKLGLALEPFFTVMLVIPPLCKLETIFLIPLICIMLDCAGSIVFQKKTRGKKHLDSHAEKEI